MDLANALNNQLLIAMPGMADPNFSSTVTLICEHNEEGALGIIINRPSSTNLGQLLQQLSLDTSDTDIANALVLNGGPVGPEQGFVLHGPDEKFESSIRIASDFQLTMSRDILESMAAGTGPARSIVVLGYAGWEAGQLEAEMLANTWLNVQAMPELIFEVPFEDRWSHAAAAMGIDIHRISPHAGHA